MPHYKGGITIAGIKEISVEGCEVIGKGGQGTIYRLDEETIVKLYSSEAYLMKRKSLTDETEQI